MRKIFPTAPVAWTADLEKAVKEISWADLWERVRRARRTGDARALGGWLWSAWECI